ncbi:hypothetical protein HYV85_04485 [Candidatus Woesearchaeota archaeon]|nr:hypothetical protein [Candidatus Woesearchaeota archaeon]
MGKVFSGTTQKNFLVCAEEKEGSVYYTKSRLAGSGVAYPDMLFYVSNLETAIFHAAHQANEVGNGHYPLVISGDTLGHSYIPGGYRYIRGNEPFKVDDVWVLKDHTTDISFLLDGAGIHSKRLEEYFTRKSPIDVLKGIN